MVKNSPARAGGVCLVRGRFRMLQSDLAHVAQLLQPAYLGPVLRGERSCRRGWGGASAHRNWGKPCGSKGPTQPENGKESLVHPQKGLVQSVGGDLRSYISEKYPGEANFSSSLLLENQCSRPKKESAGNNAHSSVALRESGGGARFK